jgi:hypothetical protein
MKFEALNILDSVDKKGYKAFLLQDFEVGILFNIYIDKHSKIIFDGWKGMEMAGLWYKAENFETKTYLEFYDTYYNIDVQKRSKREKYTFPYPRNINDFITDCNRCGVKLYYHMDALEKYSPSLLLKGEDMNEYYLNILEKIGKL